MKTLSGESHTQRRNKNLEIFRAREENSNAIQKSNRDKSKITIRTKLNRWKSSFWSDSDCSRIHVTHSHIHTCSKVYCMYSAHTFYLDNVRTIRIIIRNRSSVLMLHLEMRKKFDNFCNHQNGLKFC